MASKYSIQRQTQKDGNIKRRVHTMCNNGACIQTPYVVDKNGKLEYYAVTNPAEMSAATVQSKGGVVVSPADLNNSLTKSKQMQQVKNNLPFAVEEAEKVTGEMELMRVEMPSADSGSNTLTVTIENGEATAQSVLLGDGSGLVDNAFNVGSKAAGVAIGGTFGTNTLTLVKQQVYGGAMRLHGVHITNTNSGSASTAFFDSGRMDLCQASPIGQTDQRNKYDFARLVGGDTFNTNIREDKNFRFALAPRAALLFTVPAAEKIVCTFNVRSVTSSYPMNLL